MQMRHHVAEAGQIDLVRRKKLAHHRLDGENDGHQVVPLRRVEIAHFAAMRVPDHPTETRVIRIFDADDPAGGTLPKNRATGRGAQLARQGWANHIEAPETVSSITPAREYCKLRP